MTLFGKLKSFDQATGAGSIMPEQGGGPLDFEKSAFKWQGASPPQTDTRLSYEVGKNQAGAPTAINLRAA